MMSHHSSATWEYMALHTAATQPQKIEKNFFTFSLRGSKRSGTAGGKLRTFHTKQTAACSEVVQSLNSTELCHRVRRWYNATYLHNLAENFCILQLKL
jgi:hypothetical protein